MRHLFTRFFIACTAVLLLASPVFAATLPASTEPDPATVKSAVTSFNALSKKEKKSRIKEARKYLREVKADKRAGKAPEENTVLLVIVAILLPPLAVYLHQGEINNKFWISLLLWLLFYIPGLIYALILILGNK